MELNALKNSLNELPFNSFAIGFSEFEFAVRDNFEDFQIGFRVDENGTSLMEAGKWQESWFVIGIDDLGDPIFIDLTDQIIYTCQQSEGDIETIPIASTLERFKEIITKLKGLSLGRDTPKKFEKNPIPAASRQEFYSLLNQESEEIDVDYWGGIIED